MIERETAESNMQIENVEPQSQLAEWRQDLIQLLLRWLLGFGFFAISAASYYSYNQGDLYLLPYYWTVVVILAVITFLPRKFYGVQSWTLIGLIYFGALINFLTEGRASLGRVMLLSMTMGSILFFGLKFGVATLILSVLTMAGFAWVFITGLISDYDLVYSTNLSGWISNTSLLVLLAIFVIYSLHYLIKRYTITLAESCKLTQALEISQANLEEQVAERTHNAELARQEAERANQALEAQLEFARAQAQLNDVLRGEGQISTLADNVLSQLCGDLDFPVGALFILEDGVLTRVGKYAFPADPTVRDQLKLGEGLVGQAALEKRIISVHDVPLEGITVSSGLGQTVPSSLLIVPLVYNEQVIGVLEFGLLKDEFEKEKRFLERVSGGIAIAFNTMRDRSQIDQLLSETQRQAEALQAQEEELRAANQELQEQAKALRSGRM
jgi:putative methionine-R-sulfoxide reductase with GAF domain